MQAKLANTRVSVYTIRDNALPRDIATLLEKLYYSGDNRGFSRLIGAILVGEVPLPIVHKDDKTFPSIYPYVNFTNKAFVYNAAKGYYEFDRSQSERVDPDIWHALIRPNTGDRSLDQQKLIAFFDKTHDYYRSQGIYASGSIEASPSVFVLDSFHDEQSTSMLNWKAYNAYLENVEDFAYFRFDKHFSKRLYDKLQGDTISDLASAEIPGLTDYLSQYGISSLTGGLGLGNTTNTTDFASVPDIQTRQITTRLAKRFPEILNPRYLTDWINRTRSLGRYSSGSQTQADIVPLLIAKQDALLETALR